MPREYTHRPRADRFREKAHPDGLLLRPDLGRCWGWRGHLDWKGYACLDPTNAEDSRSRHASRVSWEIHYGPIPAGLVVCHKCDNPACTRPDHLFLDTKAGNNRDMWEKGRGRIPEGRPGERNPSAKLTGAEVAEIRRLYGAGGISQTTLAQRFHCSQVQISRVIRGESWPT